MTVLSDRENWSIGLYMWLRAWLLVVTGFYFFAFVVSATLGLNAPELAKNPQVIKAFVSAIGLFVCLPAMIIVLNWCGKTVAHHRFGYAITRFIGWSLFWRVALWHWLVGTAVWTIGISVAKFFRAHHLHGAVGVGVVLIIIASGASILAYGWITKRVVTLYGQPATAG